MRIAFIASLTRRPQMREIAKSLRAMGHEVVSTWIDSDEEDDGLTDEHKRAVAIKNINDLARGQAIVVFGENREACGVHRGTRHAEFGFVYGRALFSPTGGPKHIVIVGPRETTFHHMPCLDHFGTVAEFMTWAKQQAVALRAVAERMRQ